MNNLILLATCFIAGILLRRAGRMPEHAPLAGFFWAVGKWLALLSVGLQLRLGHLAGNGRNLALGLLFKLLLAPLALFLLYVPLLGASGQHIQVTLFEAAMPPMITAAIVAAEHDLDPELATLMVAVGISLSFLTLTGWWWIMRAV